MIGVRLLGPVAVGVSAFRDPAPRLAVIAKITVRLPAAGTSGLATVDPVPLLLRDSEELDPRGSELRTVAGEELLSASDFAPRKEFLDVTMEGYARSPTPSTHVRVALRIGDRLRRELVAVTSTPSTRIPLVGGHLRDPQVGSIVSLVPRRTHGELTYPLRAAEDVEASVCPGWTDLPPSESGSSYQAGSPETYLPLDAVLGEALLLEGVGERGAPMYTRIPAIRAYGFAIRNGQEGVRIDLHCDSLHLAPDSLQATLLFRGAHRLDLSASLPTLLVGVEPLDRPTDFASVAPWLPQATISTAQLASPARAMRQGSWEAAGTAPIDVRGTAMDPGSRTGEADTGTYDDTGTISVPQPSFARGGEVASYDGTDTISVPQTLRDVIAPIPPNASPTRAAPPALEGLPFRAEATKPAARPDAGQGSDERRPAREVAAPSQAEAVDDAPMEEELGTGTVTSLAMTPELLAALGIAPPRSRAADPLARFAPPPPKTSRPSTASPPPLVEWAAAGATPVSPPEQVVHVAPPATPPPPSSPAVSVPSAWRLGGTALQSTPLGPSQVVAPPPPPRSATPEAPPATHAEVALDRGPLSPEEYAAVRIALEEAGDRRTAEILRPHRLDVVSWALEAARWARELDEEAARGEVKMTQEIVRLIRERRSQ